MSYPAIAGSVIVTTVLLVLTTSLTAIPVCTIASQPLASAWAESSPLMMFCRWASKAAPAATQVSSVRVNRMVDPPALISNSSSSVTVPVRATAPAETVTSNVGLPTIALPDCNNAVAGTVAVIVSCAVMSYPANPGNVIVTTVLLVLTTLPTANPACTTVSQPLPSACAESSPLIMA